MDNRPESGCREKLIIGNLISGIGGGVPASGLDYTKSYPSTDRRAADLGLDAARHLAENDSYHFFEKTKDLIFTGPSGINVMDFVVAARPAA